MTYQGGIPCHQMRIGELQDGHLAQANGFRRIEEYLATVLSSTCPEDAIISGCQQ